MKFKKIIIITLLFLAVLTVSSVSAIDNNQTDVVNAEIAKNDLNLEQTNDEINSQIDEIYENPVGQIEYDSESANNILKDGGSTNTISPKSEYYSAYYGEGFRLDYTFKGDKDSSIQIKVSDGISYKNTYFTIKINKPTILHSSEWIDCSNLKIGTSTIEAYIDGTYAFTKNVIIKPISLSYDDFKDKTFPYKKNMYYKLEIWNSKSYEKIKPTYFKVKIYTGSKYKTYRIKSYNYESNSWLKIPTKKLKVGTHKITISSEDKSHTGTYTAKIKIYKKTTKKTKKKTTTKKTTTKKTTTKKKSNIKTITVKIKPGGYNSIAYKYLKYGDVAMTGHLGGQSSTGVFAKIQNANKIHVKIKKVKFYFKNMYNNKVKTKIVKKAKRSSYQNTVQTKYIINYAPYKAKIWYK